MSEPISDDAAKRPCAECGCPIIHQGGILHFEDCDQHQVGDCTICEHGGNKVQLDRLRAELAEAKAKSRKVYAIAKVVSRWVQPSTEVQRLELRELKNRIDAARKESSNE